MEPILGFFIEFFQNYPYLGIYIFLCLTGLGFPIPEDALIILSGYLVHHHANIYWMLPVSYIGALSGDILIYSLGRFVGSPIIRIPPFRWLLTERRMVKVRRLFQTHGYRIVFIGRFFPGLRGTVNLFSGLSRFPFFMFFLPDALAACISVPLWMLLGYSIGELAVALQRASVIRSWLWFAAGLVVFMVLTLHWTRKKRTAPPLKKTSGETSSSFTKTNLDQETFSQKTKR